MPEGAGASSAVKKRSVVLAGHRTSISLEEAFWSALREVARRRGLSINALVAAVDAGRDTAAGGNLSSALRVFILESCRSGELVAPQGEATEETSGAA